MYSFSLRINRMTSVLRVTGSMVFLSAASALWSQAPAPAPAPPRNLIINGGFEQGSTFQNLYDGIDNSGAIRVPRANASVYVEGSSLSPLQSAASPCVADVNGDGLPDLVVASPLGFLYWYPNTGKKGAPAFERGFLVQTYLGTAARINVGDINGDGKPDILFGNIDGGVYYLTNTGMGSEPGWVSAMGKPRWFSPPPGPPIQPGSECGVIKEVGKSGVNIGTYSAPILVDWNGDGAPDLIVGEGSYSANSIHIWLNMGSKSSPSFDPAHRFYLAFGDGREQLTPAAYDWNGDGVMDLLVGDRNGEVALFLGTKEAIKDPKKIEPLAFIKQLKIGGREKLGSLISINACDLNQDGIPDLVYGTASGAIMISYGKGTAQNPELDDAAPLKGVDFAKDFKQPASWENQLLIRAMEECSPYYGTAPMPEVLSVEDHPDMEVKEGKRCFHLSWFEKFSGWWYASNSQFGILSGESPKSGASGWIPGGAVYSTPIQSFTLGNDYELSFWSKGESMQMTYCISYSESIPDPKDKNAPALNRYRPTFGNPGVSGQWTQFKKVLRLVGTKEPGIDTNGKKMTGTFFLVMYGTGDLWIDDIRLVEIVK